MKEMSPEDKQRIEDEAHNAVKEQYDIDYADDKPWIKGYIAGATAEHERMAELLKEERNKAIDDVVFKIDERISGYTYIEGEEIAMLIRELMELKPILESLKGKSQ